MQVMYKEKTTQLRNWVLTQIAGSGGVAFLSSQLAIVDDSSIRPHYSWTNINTHNPTFYFSCRCTAEQLPTNAYIYYPRVQVCAEREKQTKLKQQKIKNKLYKCLSPQESHSG